MSFSSFFPPYLLFSPQVLVDELQRQSGEISALQLQCEVLRSAAHEADARKAWLESELLQLNSKVEQELTVTRIPAPPNHAPDPHSFHAVSHAQPFGERTLGR